LSFSLFCRLAYSNTNHINFIALRASFDEEEKTAYFYRQRQKILKFI